jgi:hypothetical protein
MIWFFMGTVAGGFAVVAWLAWQFMRDFKGPGR